MAILHENDGVQVEYHTMPPSVTAAGEARVTPRAMLGIMRALLDRGLRVFNVEPNVW